VIYLSKILSLVEKRFEEFTKDDVRKVLAHYQTLVNRGERSKSSVFEAKKTLKKFFKWLGRGELVNWFSVGNVESNISPSDLITQEEFEAMMRACFNSRDRALLSLLYETGARIGEIGAMRVKDVMFDEYGAVIWLPRSKTQRRKLRVVYSSRYLAEWLSDHPLKDDPEAPLWIKLSGKKYMQPMEYKDIQWQLKKITKRAGIKKRIYSHLFRHTRATRLLQQVSEAVGAKYMGWVPGTKMVKVYIHLADQDVERAILEMHGIKPAEDKDIKVIQCPRCSFVNPGGSKFCSRCGLPLTEEAVKEIEEWEEKKAKLLETMTKPEILGLIMSLREEIERLKKLVDERESDGDPMG
jgi:integrase